MRAIAGLLLLVAGADTLACRCAQRPLSDYFADADLVFFGEALSAHELKDAVMPTRALVVAQLTAVQGLDVLREAGANAPQRRGARDSGLIGLLYLAWHDEGSTLQLFAYPDLQSKKPMHVTAYSRLAHRELSYERAAAAVYARRGDWFALRTTEGEPAWALASPPMRFVPHADLVTGRLTYLTASWSGLVWPGPGAGLKFLTDRSAPLVYVPSKGGGDETEHHGTDARRWAARIWTARASCSSSTTAP